MTAPGSLLVVHAHPYPFTSRGCAALLESISGCPGLAVRRLYDLYPDFDIDVAAEQEALRAARAVVWLHPLYWYTAPALLKHWFEKVLAVGFAYGERGSVLAGKPCLWVTTTGGGEYSPQGIHRHPFADFVPVIEMTARYCGMRWEEPFVVNDVTGHSDDALRSRGRELRARLEALAPTPAGEGPP
jgi:glutathione-regulated potassium-efflux system ancillary protein KefF